MAEWQPIETVPEDAIVLVSSPTFGTVMVHTTWVVLGYPVVVIARNPSIGADAPPFLHSGHYVGNATHWHPLPEPPQ